MPDQSSIRSATTRVLSDYLKMTSDEQLWCFTDDDRMWLATALRDAAAGLGVSRGRVINLSREETPESVQSLLKTLSSSDVVISVLSHGLVASQYFRVFPSFRVPDGFPGRSAVIRQHYPDAALIEHLTTTPVAAEASATRALAHAGAGRVRVTGPAGTDLTCELKTPITLPYKLDAGNRHLYLPPAEVAYGIVPGSASGTIVVDITVGEVVVKGEVYDALGLVDAPVRISVEAGRVTAFSGGDIAGRLAACFARLDGEQPEGSDGRLVVELGFGLSAGTPVGMGAADECLQGTCHFGVGNDFFFGGNNAVPMHMDVILRGPASIERV